jgi:hypothetical protein
MTIVTRRRPSASLASRRIKAVDGRGGPSQADFVEDVALCTRVMLARSERRVYREGRDHTMRFIA